MRKCVSILTAAALWVAPMAQPASVFAARFTAPVTVSGNGMHLPLSPQSSKTTGASGLLATPALSPGANTLIHFETPLPAFSDFAASADASADAATAFAAPASLAESRARPSEASQFRNTGENVGPPSEKTESAAQKEKSGARIFLGNLKKLAAPIEHARLEEMSDAQAKSHGSALFDALRRARRAANTNAVAKEDSARTPEKQTFLNRLIKPAGAKTAYSLDQYGGPPKIDLKAPAPESDGYRGRLKQRAKTLLNQTVYGLKWAVNLSGIATVVTFVVKPIATFVPWQLFVSESFLNGTGRVELLTALGHRDIVEIVTQAPMSFLFGIMPQMVLMEEISYRVLDFGVTFLLIAALKPATSLARDFMRRMAQKFEIPNLFGLLDIMDKLVAVGGVVSRFAFPIALLSSSWTFAVAHIAAWGFDPTVFAVHLAAGLTLAYVAYRSRSFAAPLVAHFGFNLAMITIGVIVPMALIPSTAAVVMTIGGLFGAAFAYYNYRVYQRAKKRARAEVEGVSAQRSGFLRRAVTPLLILPFFFGLSVGFMKQNAADVEKINQAARFHQVQQSGPFLDGKIQKLLNVHTPQAEGEDAAVGEEVEKKTELTTEEITKNAKPAIVMVQTGSGLGTGFIIEKEGLVVTNAHVVAHGNAHVDKVVIKFTNGNKVDGVVIAFNKDKDLALIKLVENPLGYPTVEIGDSKTLSEGERIIAMGHPRGLPFSVSEGIVSGLDFRHNGHLRFIQHDAAVNPGNSGGPLFNKYGEVVAVNTAIASNAGGFDGISFSIPTEDLKKALEQFKAINNIDTAWLGAIFYPNSPNAPAFGLYVDTVRMDSPSEAAGLRAGDIIVGVDDRHLSNVPEEAVAQLSLYLRSKTPTDKITLKVSRDGAVEEIVVELGVKRPNPYMEMLRIQEEITKKFAPLTK